MPMLLHRPPPPALAPFVECLWYADGEGGPGEPRAPRERSLPTGSTTLVVRLSDHPIRIFAGLDDDTGRTFGQAVVGGARSAYYVRDTSRPIRSAGVYFRPGGASAFLGIPGDELAGRHTALADLWGRGAVAARERLLEAGSPAAALAALGELVLDRLPAGAALHPAVAHALARFDASAGAAPVGAVCRETGLSHRRLIELFRRAVGLTPKVYCRIRRFQVAVARAARDRTRGWAALAQECGFSDQAHLIREFRAFAGIPPGRYEPVSADSPNHVPVRPDGGRSIPSKRGGAPIG